MSLDSPGHHFIRRHKNSYPTTDDPRESNAGISKNSIFIETQVEVVRPNITWSQELKIFCVKFDLTEAVAPFLKNGLPKTYEKMVEIIDTILMSSSF